MIEPGTIINERYRIVRHMGDGGMGSVYEAQHTGVGRKVAVKVLHPQFANNREIVERFGREARAAAAIGQDNIIDILDVGSHAGLPLIIMEYLKGETLAERLAAAGTLSPEAAAHVAVQILQALAAAHKAGIIHRDLKPDNVFLIERAGVTDFVKILDFGVSKFTAMGPSVGGGQQLTADGAVLGTPFYMAPEQAMGVRDIDARADLYSVGVMLYQMVTGKRPFEGRTHTELLLAVINGTFAPPRTLLPNIPGEFEGIIVRAMSRDRNGRPSDAMEFAKSLEPWAKPGATAASARQRVPSSFPSTSPEGAPTPLGWEKKPDTTGTQAAIQAALRGGRTTQTGVPAATSTATPAPVSAPAPVPARSRTPVIALGLVGLLAVGGVIAGVVVSRGGSNHAAVGATSQPAVPSVPSTTSIADPAGNSVPQPAGASVPAVAEPPRPTVTIDLDGLPGGAVLYVDNESSLTTHLSFPQGSNHTIRVTAPGRLPYEAQVTADANRQLTVNMALDPALTPDVAAAPPPPATEPAPARPLPGIAHRPGTGAVPPHVPLFTAPGGAAPPPGTGRRPPSGPLPLSNTY